MQMDFKAYANFYFDQLNDNVIPFWLKHSKDSEHGGYFTCLDREGKIYDTDKFVWLQARQVWCFSMLYNQVQKKQEWLDFAIHGAEFLKRYGMDNEGNWYFSLTREGLPLVQPYNIFSDCFATMAFGQLYKATAQQQYADIALRTFHNIVRRQDNPKGKYLKTYPGTRPLQGFSLPMILSNLVLEIETLLDRALVERTIEQAVHAVMDIFYQPDLGLILENVSPEGKFSDSFEGRLLNPGHAIEGMWFMMDLASRSNDQKLMRKSVDIALSTLEYGWDEKHNGILYFLDVKGHPPQQLEWDQKLWWVHIETLITLLKGYLYTGETRCLEWFEKVHEYSWKHFADAEFGEWYGYLNRQGEVLLPLKGGKWKGCFHVPRGFYQCWKTLNAIAGKQLTSTVL
jgi:N-acylglucosamine 2-epimerase